MSEPLELPFAEVYIDESSHTKHRYLVIGGVIAERSFTPLHEASIRDARLPELPGGILKWTKVSRSKLPAYKRVVDAFFNSLPNETLDFHSLVIDTEKLDHEKYNQGSRDIGFNKEIYQLSLKFGRLYQALLHIYPDRRTTGQKTEDLRLMLNRGLKKKGDTRDWPFRRLQFREPEDSQLLQLADLFSGAIAWAVNGHGERPEASPAKVELSQYILNRAGIRNPTRDTTIRGKFTIWHRKLRP